jgi:hypothetical protein
LRVGLDQLNEPEFLTILGDLLKHRNHVTGGAGGQPQLTVRSTSLGADQLAEAHRLVMSTNPWSAVRNEVLTSLDDIVPAPGELQTARASNRFSGGPFARDDWTRFKWSPPTARPPATAPDHLSDAPARQVFTEGYWLTDFSFEYDGPGPSFSSQNRWMLPLRWRMAGAFELSFVGSLQRIALPPARRNRDGNLVTFVSAEHPVDLIEVPTAYEAMGYAFAKDGAWAEPDAEHGLIRPPRKVVWTAPSNEARYLTGVLGMTGGLRRAGQFLLHPFLREHFAKLGGTPNLPADKVTLTINRLRKRAQREAAFDLMIERDKQALADLIVKAARTLKNPMAFVSYDDLKSTWRAYRETFWAAQPPQAQVADPDIDWDEAEEESLDACLIELRQRQMMFQGHQWTCRKCHHRNWVDLGALSSELSCEVCKTAAPTPVNVRWLFRPNDFLIESLRDHSVLSLLWTLSALCDRSRRSFIFVEPTWFGFSDETASPDAEADLLVLIDGQAMLCEVKSSWRSLRAVDISDFVALANRLRPDTALLAVMETVAGPIAELAEAKAQLAVEGITFELLTPDAYMPRDDPYLHFDAEG